MKKRILIVEDDMMFGTMLKGFLTRNGFDTEHVTSVSGALQFFKESTADLVLSDLRLPDSDGMELLEMTRKFSKSPLFIMMTGYAEISTAVQAMKSGASDYIAKPVVPDLLIQKIQDLFAPEKKVEAKPVQKEASTLQSEERCLRGNSEKAGQLYELVDLVAPTDIAVLINGASGTGKEYVARTMHQQSKRAQGPFVAIDCGALPKEIAASELFGHVKGSFTGAVQDKKGHFESAQGGTIFLDEIGNLSYEVQVQLLRVLQEKKVRPVGGNQEIELNVRVVSATNENLSRAIQEGAFREDLFHRINEFTLQMPTLSERREDIMLFANFFLDQTNRELEKEIVGFDPAAERCLQNYVWPGNLRELKNVIKRAVLLSKEMYITPFSLPLEIQNSTSGSLNKLTPLRDSDQEKNRIIEALQQTGNNKSKAAKLLGVDRKTLYNKLKVYDLDL